MRKLDLHGMRYEDAKRAVEKLANSYWAWDQNDEAEIITGHSPDMRNMAIGILKEYEIEHYVGGPMGIDDTFIKIYKGY
jgi:DNA-nicking Smr family endonuclease